MGRYAYVTQAPLPDQRRTSSRKRGIHGSSQVIPALARSQLARTAQLGQPDTRAHRRLGQPVQRRIAAMTQPVGAFLRHATRLRHNVDVL